MESVMNKKVEWSVKRTKAIELHLQGIPTMRVAEQVGASAQAVRDWLRAEGYEPIHVRQNVSRHMLQKKRQKGRFAHLK